MTIYESLKGPGVQKSRALLSEVCVPWMRWGGSRFSTTLYERSKKPHKRREMEKSHGGLLTQRIRGAPSGKSQGAEAAAMGSQMNKEMEGKVKRPEMDVRMGTHC